MLHFDLFVTPSKLLDTIIELSTVNSRVPFLESIIGSYKLDVGFVYNQPGENDIITIDSILQLNAMQNN